MSPQVLKYIIDGATLLLGIYVMVQMMRSALGGAVGFAFRLILIGIFILAINHLADTVYFAGALKAAGHTTDYLQAPIVHRLINFIGFIFMAFGFMKLTRSQQ